MKIVYFNGFEKFDFLWQFYFPRRWKSKRTSTCRKIIKSNFLRTRPIIPTSSSTHDNRNAFRNIYVAKRFHRKLVPLENLKFAELFRLRNGVRPYLAVAAGQSAPNCIMPCTKQRRNAFYLYGQMESALWPYCKNFLNGNRVFQRFEVIVWKWHRYT